MLALLEKLKDARLSFVRFRPGRFISGTNGRSRTHLPRCSCRALTGGQYAATALISDFLRDFSSCCFSDGWFGVRVTIPELISVKCGKLLIDLLALFEVVLILVILLHVLCGMATVTLVPIRVVISGIRRFEAQRVHIKAYLVQILDLVLCFWNLGSVGNHDGDIISALWLSRLL